MGGRHQVAVGEGWMTLRPKAAMILAVVASLAASCSSPTPTSTPRAVSSPTATSAVSPSPRVLSGSIAKPGDEITVDAVDRSGVWGSITITRGKDVGGYPTQAISGDTFVIELFARYHGTRQPDIAMFGAGDWTLVAAGALAPVGRLFAPAQPPNPANMDPQRQPLVRDVGALDLQGTDIVGALFFAVPRAEAQISLALVYRPQGAEQPLAIINVRQPGVAPHPVPTATPVPTPAPVTYRTQPGSPFTIIDSAAADALFSRVDTCTNPVGQFTVHFPAVWYTNPTIGALPACSWFAPTPFSVSDFRVVPHEVAIVVMTFNSAYGSFNLPEVTFREEILIGGHQGDRYQQIGLSYEGGGHESLPPSYIYTANFGSPIPAGPSMRALTASDGASDYILNKAVLDRIMASLVSHPG
jgi:hypothetical protein